MASCPGTLRHVTKAPDRPALDEAMLRARLVEPGGLVHAVHVTAETESTNDDVAKLAAAGAAEGTVVVAEYQRRGRGRLDRTWISPPRAGLTVSMLLRPTDVSSGRWSWLPLLAGCAVTDAITATTGLAPRLKWPNDVLVGDRKVGGILLQRVDTPEGPAAVLGFGVNVSHTPPELPAPTATSLLAELTGAPAPDRHDLLSALLSALANRYRSWLRGRGDPAGVRTDYRALCATLGRKVRVEVELGRWLDGHARDIDDDGRLILSTASGVVAQSAGDVLHVR